MATRARENVRDDAMKRRNLDGGIRFDDLGDVIKQVLKQLPRQVTEEEVKLLSHITVRQMAKVYEMLEAEEDADKIVGWLKRQAQSNIDAEDPYGNHRKAKVKTGAERDAIAYFKEVERKNIEVMNQFKEAAAQRAKEREQNVAARATRREELTKKREAEAEAAKKNGEDVDVVGRMAQNDRKQLAGAFDRFAKNKGADEANEGSDDKEWWKSDEYRREFEKSGRKGKKWTAVIENADTAAPESELAAREEWYRSQNWWKADKYKRDWAASRGTEWWKEETYIRDWQENGAKGKMWAALDEQAGFMKRAQKKPASIEEQARRVAWYKTNGPRGIVKAWAALAEGTKDRCTLEEKREREDYFKNGDWWKSGEQRRQFASTGHAAGLTASGPAAADREWWKDDKYRRDFEAGGRLWRAPTEQAAASGKVDEPCTESEAEKRKQWYADNWWKADKFLKEWEQQGSEGKKWQARDAKEAESASPKPCKESELAQREQWYKSALDEKDWWKNDMCRRDFEENGRKGKRWQAATEAAANGGIDEKASADEIAKREEYFRKNWWKADKYVRNFNRNKGGAGAWSAAANDAHVDKDWWKADECRRDYNQSRGDAAGEWWQAPAFVEDFVANGLAGKKWRAADADLGLAGLGDKKSAPELDLAVRRGWYEKNHWKSPEALRDFVANKDGGKRWTAKTAAAAAAGKGDVEPASVSELEARKEWYGRNWWKAPEVVADWEDNGAIGKKWTKNRDGSDLSPKQLKERHEYYSRQPQTWWKSPEMVGDFVENGESGKQWGAATRAAAELATGDVNPATDEEKKERKTWMVRNWWKSPAAIADYLKNGDAGGVWTAADAETGRAGKGATKPASDAEKDHRRGWMENNWWKAPDVQRDFESGGKRWTRNADGSPASVDQMKERRDFFEQQPQTWWKAPEYIADYQKNKENGAKWRAADAVHGSVGKAGEAPASADEAAARAKWYDNNWWKSPEAKSDFVANGFKGKVWTRNPDGSRASDAELLQRKDWYQTRGDVWSAAGEPEAVKGGAGMPCSAAEALAREEWFKNNWWKSPEVREEYEELGPAATMWKAGSPEAALAGEGGNPKFQVSAEELERREEWLKNNSDDTEWWKEPSAIEDFVRNGDKGCVWRARNAIEGANAAGQDHPASAGELARREGWYRRNFWKASPASEEFGRAGGDAGKSNVWAAGSVEDMRKGLENADARARDPSVAFAPTGAAPEEELAKRRQWLGKRSSVPEEEQRRRAEWLRDQASDEERATRRAFFRRMGEESRSVRKDELADLMKAVNDGVAPTDEDVRKVYDAIRDYRNDWWKRGEDGPKSDSEGIAEEEFMRAVAETGFYVSPDEAERRRAEQEELERLQQEEMNREMEEAAFLAMEQEEELQAAGITYEDKMAEEEFIRQVEEAEDGKAAGNNEDDMVDEDQEDAWQEFLKAEAAPELTPEEEAALEEAARKRAEEEAAKLKAEQDAWQESAPDGGIPEYAEEYDEEGEEAGLTDADKENLEAEIAHDPTEYEMDDEEEVTEPNEEDAMAREEKGVPPQWKLPLPQVTNPHYLKAYFTVIKYTPSHSLMGGKQKRVWVVDHFTRSFYNLEPTGKIKKEHSSNKLLQLEKNLLDAKRLRMMFFDASHSYELQFETPADRERFYETASAIRPSMRVYSPELTKPDNKVEYCTTTIDGVGPNAMTVKVPNKTGKTVNRELSGECKINSSKVLTEPLTVWVGTFNLSGNAPPRNANDLAAWMPKDKYDIYAVAVQEASYRKDENEWFDYVCNYLGREYLTLASMNLWDTLLIVLTRKKNLLKVTNVEGSTKATVHKNVCGTKGGVGISIRYLETSMCFVTCHLAARMERTAMRNTNLEEVVDCLQLAMREVDFTNQFNHCFLFGDLNYRVEMEAAEAESLIAGGNHLQLLDHDQLAAQMREESVLHGFTEPPVMFAPTYRYQRGTAQYASEKGSAPSYCDRVLFKSMDNTWIKCTGYDACPTVACSEHKPVAATFIVRAVRPTMSCFAKQQDPQVQFRFSQVRVTENKGPQIKKPMLMLHSPFSGSPHSGAQLKAAATTPEWNNDEIPVVEAVNHLPEYLETGHIVLIVRDASEKRDDKALRGSAVLTLGERVNGQLNVAQQFELDMTCHGRLVGKITGSFRMERQTVV